MSRLRIGRLPIRIRVTLAFATAIAVLLGAVGLFLYLQFEKRLDESLEDGLRSRAGELSALVGSARTGLGGANGDSLIEQEESFAQVLGADGRVIDSTPQLRGRATLTPSHLEAAAAAPRFLERSGLPGIEATARLLTTPVEANGERLVIVVGSSLEDRNEALASLATLLLIGGPVALLLASLAGYWAAGRALRPVEAMRRRAAEISAEPGERLPLSAADDELRRLGETLNAMLGRLETALERERRFVDDASHELRTPLALHKTELELALRYEGGERELRAAIASGVEEVDRLIQLAEDLLVVARSERGELALRPERLAVGDLLATVRERFAARASVGRRPLLAEAADGLVVDGDRVRLEQALTSMVDNALRHGGGEVRLWARRNGARVELHVTDGGPGFPAEFLARAFERFSRADAARTRGGVGLGLAIVETIAAAHGGDAGAANARGGGADVWIAIPDGA